MLNSFPALLLSITQVIGLELYLITPSAIFAFRWVWKFNKISIRRKTDGNEILKEKKVKFTEMKAGDKEDYLLLKELEKLIENFLFQDKDIDSFGTIIWYQKRPKTSDAW